MTLTNRYYIIISNTTKGGCKMRTLTLRKLREKNRLTPYETAQKLGITYTYLYLMETGKRNPSDKIKSKMCELYETDMNNLFLSINLTKTKVK